MIHSTSVGSRPNCTANSAGLTGRSAISSPLPRRPSLAGTTSDRKSLPYRARVVEDALKGKDIKSTIKQAAAQIRTVARPMSLNSYKVDIAQGLVERTVLEALG